MIPPQIPPLRRRLELVQLVNRLIKTQPNLAAQSAAFDLADSLAELINEMHGEGVDLSVLDQLDVTDMSGHWQRSLSFMQIVRQFIGKDSRELDVEAHRRAVVAAQIDFWKATPPDHPVIVAGSTGSRGTTLMLMTAVAQLPQGALILPGFDTDLPDAVWHSMRDALVSEDHPQFRFHKVLTACDIEPGRVRIWSDLRAPAPARNKVVSLALRPAPVTNSWRDEGPRLTDLDKAFENVTLVETENARAEAVAIALRLRQAVEIGQRAAVITPDRQLTRQVTAALDRWGILPDDSAGMPLHLSPPGRLLRHVADIFAKPLSPDRLLAILKHPLCARGADRGRHALMTQELELYLRCHGPPFPDGNTLTRWAKGCDLDGAAEWARWVSDVLLTPVYRPEQPLRIWVAKLTVLAEAVASGFANGSPDELWAHNAGRKARSVITGLMAEAPYGGVITARDFISLLDNLLSKEAVRDRDAPHPNIMIWGTMEARVQGADLVILAALNDGTWPESAWPDPWLNRTLRLQAGLLMPERRIGLSAHDFQQAIGAAEVWLTRARRSDDADTVPSRWLNRLTSLLSGLDMIGGPQVLEHMRKRGDKWAQWATRLDDGARTAPAPRPAPRPPVAARPRSFRVTEIKHLIRDPYAIYAKHILRLRPLDPLGKEPDALDRGIILHAILESFLRSVDDDSTAADLVRTAKAIIETEVPWPTAQRMWLAQVRKFAHWFMVEERLRRAKGHPAVLEAKGKLVMADMGITLTARADRIDLDPGGHVRIYDYKAGNPPTAKEQILFDKQLLLETAMVTQGAFTGLSQNSVVEAVFIGLVAQKNVSAPLDKVSPDQTIQEFRRLLTAYLSADQGFTSRRMPQKETDAGDYDHLARYGEWDRATRPSPEYLL